VAPVTQPLASSASRPVTHASKGIRKLKSYTDDTVRWGLSAMSAEPANLQDSHWKEAMDEEYSALMKNKTWRLVPSPQGKNIIDCRCINKIKHRADGSIDRYKARLVAKGFK
jgi:histone deacetylase 1/2